MSRELKFRVWVTNGDGVTYSQGDHMEHDVTIQKGKYASVEGGWDIQGLYDYPLMQYTGLKDKNGVEIYEGDIVEEPSSRYKVIYHADGFYMRNIYEPDNILLQLRHGYLHCEVIGNIYENPELAATRSDTPNAEKEVEV